MLTRTPAILLLGVSGWLTLAGCQSPPGPNKIVVERSAWRPAAGWRGQELITAHYRIRTTLDDTVLLERIPVLLETAHARFGEQVPSTKGDTGRLDVYLFARREEWAQFTRHFVPVQADTYLHIRAGGYMDHATATIVIFYIGREQTLSLLGHEAWHQYLTAHLDLAMPAWLNEGLACQWEAFSWRDGHPIFKPTANTLRRTALRQGLADGAGLIPLETLLNTHAGIAVRKTGRSTQLYYAQLWGLILFLRQGTDPDYSAGFMRLLGDLVHPSSTDRNGFPGPLTNQPQSTIFRQYISDDLQTFEQRYLQYLRNLVY